jgi:hypothetical protein
VFSKCAGKTPSDEELLLRKIEENLIGHVY